MASFTSITHKKPYVEISSAKSSLSKTGQTVLITGGASGIGYAITEAFAQASASNIIIVGRQADRLNIAVSKIRSENKFEGTITGRECDIADLSSVNKLWSQLRQEGVTVDILVLNAVHVSPIQRVLDGTPNEICVEFQTNVLASFEMTRLFFHQTNHSGQKKVCSYRIYGYQNIEFTNCIWCDIKIVSSQCLYNGGARL
jgi:NAD(P)-dependent dehydrogenase (short-subunit alcohol dehydrogenase family)